ncbi:hypothetical protein HZC07_05680 [Candidatus Micrarchaeota archaeon]|nr:hypothetical protein [Candidatus Micrarchaeota archaeon]
MIVRDRSMKIVEIRTQKKKKIRLVRVWVQSHIKTKRQRRHKRLEYEQKKRRSEGIEYDQMKLERQKKVDDKKTFEIFREWIDSFVSLCKPLVEPKMKGGELNEIGT